MHDIGGRSGIGNAWGCVDADTRDEITERGVHIVEREIADRDEEPLVPPPPDTVLGALAKALALYHEQTGERAGAVLVHPDDWDQMRLSAAFSKFSVRRDSSPVGEIYGCPVRLVASDSVRLSPMPVPR